MENLGYSFEQRPIVAFFVDKPDSLEISILENLLSSFCRVKVFTVDKDLWKIKTAHLKDSKYLEIFTFNFNQNFFDVSYIISINRKDIATSIQKIYWVGELSKRNYAKTFFIFPLAFENESERQQVENVRLSFRGIENIGLIFVGDVIGPRMILEDDFLSILLRDSILEKKINIPNKEFLLYPVFPYEVGRQIVRLFFSFGPYGDELALTATPVKFSTFLEILIKKMGVREIGYQSRELRREELNIKHKEFLKTSTEVILSETYSWFSLNPPQKIQEKVAFKIPRPSIKIKKLFVLPMLVLLFITILPFFSLFLTISTLIFAKGQLLKGNTYLAEKLLVSSEIILVLPRKELSIVSNIPLFGEIFASTYSFSVFLQKATTIFRESVHVSEVSTDFLIKILGDEAYEPSDYSEKIYLSLDKIYRDTSFLQSEVSSLGIYSNLVREIADEEVISDLREKISLAKEAIPGLSRVLGDSSQAIYLVLFQNNMELRPTGGFIGSFGLVTFEAGRLKDIKVYDVYSADGQLKGYIEPPAPIRDYLGEASWFLRDANWDPDFPTSAVRTEWFLEKEIGKSVDGVVGIDLNAVGSLLKIIGPVTLPELKKEINPENLYEVIQEEVEGNFFPGSQRKANILTSLSRQIMLELSELKPRDNIPLLISLLDGLDRRHIQVFLHDSQIQDTLLKLGYGGTVSQPSCDAENCFADFLGLVEANLGVNKANYFIKRKMKLETFFDNSSIKKRLTVEYQNTASSILDDKGSYKVYIRLLSPLNSNFDNVEILKGSEKESLVPEILDIHGRKEAGIFIEVPPANARSVIFSWQEKRSLNFKKSGEYRFYFRKQAGTNEDPVSITLTPPFGLSLRSVSDGFLTTGSAYVYNTTLAKDIFSRISW